MKRIGIVLALTLSILSIAAVSNAAEVTPDLNVLTGKWVWSADTGSGMNRIVFTVVISGVNPDGGLQLTYESTRNPGQVSTLPTARASMEGSKIKVTFQAGPANFELEYSKSGKDEMLWGTMNLLQANHAGLKNARFYKER